MNGLMTTVEVAERTGVSVPTVKRWLQTGVLLGTKLGGTWFVEDVDLQEFIENDFKPKPGYEIEDCAIILGTTEETIRAWIADRKLRATTIKGTLQVDKKQIHKLIEKEQRVSFLDGTKLRYFAGDTPGDSWTTTTEEHWISLEEAQKLLGATEEQLLLLLEKANIPAYVVGKQWKVPKAKIQWIRQDMIEDALNKNS
ncbi:MAG: helix-turn-helix domain-containing protein [Sporomusaceae bacterium]|nr:helix-turn-helix domain-containing protein [Sporomusaceae bacterium]